MRRSRGLFAAGAVLVLLGGIVGAALWPESGVVQRTSVLVASTQIVPGEALSAENTLRVSIEGPVAVPVIVQDPSELVGLVAGVLIPGGTVLHQGLLVSLEESVRAAGRAVVEMGAEVLPLRAVPGSYVRLVEIPSGETAQLLEACGSYLYELRQVSVERTGLPEEVPVVGSAQACEAAEVSWSLPDRIGAGPVVGGRECGTGEEREAPGTLSERFTRVAEMSGASAEAAVAEAERLAGEVGVDWGARQRRVRLAEISDSLAGRAVDELEATHEVLALLGGAEGAALVRELTERAEADLGMAGSGAAAVARVVDEALREAREKVAQSAADEAAAVPHRCVEELGVNWPSGRGSIEVQVLAVRGSVAEIGVESEYVTGVLEAIGEGRVVGYMAARDDRAPAGAN